ncbi:MAG: nuclease-related domain-containing protein, partial [Candidatus Kariarchaeaceae archaeon]
MATSTEALAEASLLDQRWKDIKTAIYNLACEHPKHDLILALLKLREDYTAAPSLREITNFTGFDVAIKAIQGWNWKAQSTSHSLDVDATEIGRYGAELMVVHLLKESIRNNLLVQEDGKLVETDQGKVHFDALNSFNVDITGSRMDIARKRFLQSRLTKQQRSMDPVNKIPIVKHLYWENSILMLLRAPLPFYHAMASLSVEEQEYLLDFHSKLVSKSDQNSSGLVKVRLTRSSRPAKILTKLTPPRNNKDRRPRFVACVIADSQDDKIEFHIGLGALTMFTMFLMGFDRDHLDDKARRAENAVRAVIEHSGHWSVVESNTDVVMEGGDVITEIDIIAQSTLHKDDWLTIEVKDFSFWRGWIFGHGADSRREYYMKAIGKLPIKEDYIRQKHSIDEITSIIV